MRREITAMMKNVKEIILTTESEAAEARWQSGDKSPPGVCCNSVLRKASL